MRAKVIDPTIRDHGGVLVKLTGDGFLAEFGLVAAAMHCAMKVQDALNAAEVSTVDELRIQFRMGLHIGDVVHDDADIFGDGVNVAARLEALAPVGGIAVSGIARDALKNTVAADYIDQGEQRLKNLETPVRVYHVGGHAVPDAYRPAMTRWIWGSVAALAAVAVLTVALLRGDPDISSTAGDDRDSTPSIVVMPLENLSGSDDQAYFANGLTEDITTDLSGLQKLFVVPRNTARKFAATSSDPRQVSEALGIRFGRISLKNSRLIEA